MFCKIIKIVYVRDFKYRSVARKYMEVVAEPLQNFYKGFANYNNVEIELAKYEYLLNTIYKNPRVTLNRRDPRRVYLDKVRAFIIDGYNLIESILKTLETLEDDYRKGLIRYYSYYRARKTLQELLKRAKRLWKQISFKELLADFLLMICKTENLSKIKASIVSEWLGIDLETANKFLQWLKNSEYDIVAKCVIRGKSKK